MMRNLAFEDIAIDKVTLGWPVLQTLLQLLRSFLVN